MWSNKIEVRTQLTRICSFAGLEVSTALLPVINSSRKTPKLYTSLLELSCPVIAYLHQSLQHLSKKMDTGVSETKKKTAHTQVHDSQMFQEPWSNEVELPYQELGLTNQNQLF